MLIGVIAAGRRRNSITGYTFGEYPYFVDSLLNVAAGTPESLLRDQGQPDFDNFNIGSVVPEASLTVTSNYVLHTLTDIDNLSVSAANPEGTLIVTSNYVTHTLTDIDDLNVGASIPEGALVVTANYATHDVYDVDNLNVSASSPEATLT